MNHQDTCTHTCTNQKLQAQLKAIKTSIQTKNHHIYVATDFHHYGNAPSHARYTDYLVQ